MKMSPPKSAGGERSSDSTSLSLLARLNGNDPAAWDRLVALYAPLVWHWCRRMRLEEQDIADVFQDVFQAVASNLANFRKDRPSDTFRGWLRIITRNKVHDHFRRRRHEPRGHGGALGQVWLQQVAEPDWPDDEAEDNALYRKLFHRALALIQADFEERTWRAFWRVVVEGQAPRDVAEELGMRAGTVRVAKCRVLHRLRQELGDSSA